MSARWGAIALIALGGCVENLAVFAVPADAGVDAGVPFVVDQIAAAQDHACAVHSGALFCWGSNADGQLGTGDVQPRTVPTRVGSDSTWAEVRLGYTSTCARKTDGTVWCWGDNMHGQLGRGVAGNVRVPTQVALGFSAKAIAQHFQHACAIATSGELWCWGLNTEGQLGLNDGFPSVDQLAPQHVAAGTLWSQMDTGQGHGCGIQTDGSLWCWGRNGPPELGQPSGFPLQVHVPTRVGLETGWAHVATTQNGSCALKLDGSLWCWGYVYNEVIDTYAPVYEPQRVGVDTDWSEIQNETFDLCVLKRSGINWCWGRNDEGQLGTGDNVSRFTPGTIDGSTWKTGSMGRMFRCALNPAGAVSCTGENAQGQLGTGDTQRRNMLTPITLQ